MDQVEGFYLETIDFSGVDEHECFDGEKDKNRQLSIFIVLSQSNADLVIHHFDEQLNVPLTEGKILLMPSNFTSFYTIKSTGEKVKLIKMFRHEGLHGAR